MQLSSCPENSDNSLSHGRLHLCDRVYDRVCARAHEHATLADDVEESVKQRRLREVIDTFNAGARASNEAEVDAAPFLLLSHIVPAL